MYTLAAFLAFLYFKVSTVYYNISYLGFFLHFLRILWQKANLCRPLLTFLKMSFFRVGLFSHGRAEQNTRTNNNSNNNNGTQGAQCAQEKN